MKNNSGIVVLIFVLASCGQSTYTIKELKGTYQEVQTKSSNGMRGTLIIKDSSLIVKDCFMMHDFVGKKVNVYGTSVWYEYNSYSSSFEIFKKKNIVYLFKSFEDNEYVTFKKIN